MTIALIFGLLALGLFLTIPMFIVLTGTAFGVDFNPTVDRLRVVGDDGQNLRINVDNGVATADGSLNFPGDTARARA